MDLRFSDTPVAAYDGDLLAVGASSEFATELEALDSRMGGHLINWLRNKGFSGKAGSRCSRWGGRYRRKGWSVASSQNEEAPHQPRCARLTPPQRGSGI